MKSLCHIYLSEFVGPNWSNHPAPVATQMTNSPIRGFHSERPCQVPTYHSIPVISTCVGVDINDLLLAYSMVKVDAIL